jgi:hypothetical protein
MRRGRVLVGLVAAGFLLLPAQTPAAAASYSLTTSPAALVWVQGQTGVQQLTIINNGTLTETFSVQPGTIGGVNEYYAANLQCSGTAYPMSAPIAPGQSCTVDIGFTPNQTGRQDGTVALNYGPTGSGYQHATPLTGYNYAFWGMYTLDAYGGVHPNGCQPLGASPAFGWKIARALALIPTQQVPGAYVLDGLGGVHPVGNAPAVNDWPRFGFDIAVDIKLMPTANSQAAPGYVLDGWGGIHPFGGAAATHGGPYWPGWRIAKKMVILPDGSGGYVLDGWGGLHPFAIGGGAMPPPMASAYWPGNNLARDVDFDIGLPTIGGVTLDAWGGVHPFGSEPPIAHPGPYWPHLDVARAVRLDDSGAQPSEGWVMDYYGGLHSFNANRATVPVPPFPYPIPAVDLAEY